MRTVGEAARFIRSSVPAQRRHDLIWRHAFMSLEDAAKAGDAASIANATMALELLLKEAGLLSE